MVRSVPAILVRMACLLALLAAPPVLGGDGKTTGHECCTNAMSPFATAADPYSTTCGASHCTVCAAMIVDVIRTSDAGNRGAACATPKPTPPIGRAHDAPPAPPPRRG